MTACGNQSTFPFPTESTNSMLSDVTQRSSGAAANIDDALLIEILASNRSFVFCDTENELTVDQLNMVIGEGIENAEVSIIKYALADIDGDGVTEALLWPKLNQNDAVGTIILKKFGDKISAYLLYYRQANNFKSDGRFLTSAGAGHSSVERIAELTESGLTQAVLASFEVQDGITRYKIENTEVAENEYNTYIADFENSSELMWIEI